MQCKTLVVILKYINDSHTDLDLAVLMLTLIIEHVSVQNNLVNNHLFNLNSIHLKIINMHSQE